GILRARYRESGSRPVPLTPGRVHELTVDLWATANTFRKGHRIRVAVTSSSFPRFDRNLNTGGPNGSEAKGQVALNTVFHDAARPFRILLPVVNCLAPARRPGSAAALRPTQLRRHPSGPEWPRRTGSSGRVAKGHLRQRSPIGIAPAQLSCIGPGPVRVTG